MIRYFLWFFLSLLAAGVTAQPFPKALLRGDYPDPSILRDGKDFYMTHSPFFYSPGFLIWHSRDMMNWEPLCRALPDCKGSAMAPDLIKHDGRFYLYFPSGGTNWVSWADSITGPWSEPIDLKVKGIDPGHVVDRDGNRYLFFNEGEVIRLTNDGLATVGEKQKVYDGWAFPDSWETEGMYLESPKFTYHNGYYYLTSAQGGTAGPSTSHMAVSARARDIMGPWENSPYNPIVHTYDSDDEWWSKGHGTLVDDVNGDWWIVYHAYHNDFHTLGRATLIEPIEWTDDGWFKAVQTRVIPTPPSHSISLSDDFTTQHLGLQWTFWKEYGLDNIHTGDSLLIVPGKGLSPGMGRLMLITPEHREYEVSVELTVNGKNNAGMLLFYDENVFAGAISDGHEFMIYSDAETVTNVKNELGNNFRLKLHNDNNSLSIYVSSDGAVWQPLAQDIDVSSFHHNNHNGFYALRPALVSLNGDNAMFSKFRYIGK